MSRQFYPSNGTEGYSFIDYWCATCERDKDEDCRILGESFLGPVKEWIINEGGCAECTAYIERGKPIPFIDEWSGDLFEALK